MLDVISPAPREAWREILSSDPNAEVSQTPEWLDALCAVGGFIDATRLYHLGNGRQLLLLLARRTLLPGAVYTGGAWPVGWGIGGALATGGLTDADVRLAVADMARLPYLRVHLSPTPPTAPFWAGAMPPNAFVVRQLLQRVDLSGGWDAVWKQRFQSSARQAFRRAERSNAEVETDSAGRLIPIYYDLYEKSVERWAEQQHEPLILARLRARRRDPLEKIQTIARNLGERCTVWLARVGGQPAAALIVLRHGAIAKYWRGAMDRELANEPRANNLLHSLVMKQACEEGFRWYDMGDSVPGSSLARFKNGLGAIDLPYSSYWVERLPVSRADAAARDTVKKVLRWREAY